MNQQQAWEQEYQSTKGIPTSTRTRPSSSIIWLLNQRAHQAVGPNAIDLGCGNGRNTTYLAKLGYHVAAVDFARSALDTLSRLTTGTDYGPRVTIRQVDLGLPLPFPDNHFDLALDITTTSSLSNDQLTRLESELWRILRPKGLLLAYIDAHDGLSDASAPRLSSPLSEAGITNYYRDDQNLRRIYANWRILDLDLIEKTDTLYGRDCKRRLWRMLVQR